MDCSLPGTSIHGILQARVLEWVAISFSNAWKWSRVQLLETPWTAAYQAPPSMGFSRQECWSGVPLSSLMDVVHLLFLNAVPTFGLQPCISLFSKSLPTHSPQKTKRSILANVYVLGKRTCIFKTILGDLFLFLNYQQLVCIVFAISCLCIRYILVIIITRLGVSLKETNNI